MAWQVSLADSCQVTLTPGGFVIAPQGVETLRTPFSVAIQLLMIASPTEGYRARDLGAGRVLWYSIGMRAEGMIVIRLRAGTLRAVVEYLGWR
jgi:hypothetical protein